MKRPIYSAETKEEARRLYVDEELSAAAVAVRLGLKRFTVKQWMVERGVIRSMSEAAAISCSRQSRATRGRNSGRLLWQSTKSGRWEFAESSYEIARMRQLDADATVASWGRCADRIRYADPRGGERAYNPDFAVEYMTGERVVEEIKPLKMCSLPVNVAKFAAALTHYERRGIRYRVLTESDLGDPSLRSLDLGGLVGAQLADMKARDKETRQLRYQHALKTETATERIERRKRDALRKLTARISTALEPRT